MERSADCALYLHPGTGWGSSACGGMTLARSKSHYTGRCGVQRPEARGFNSRHLHHFNPVRAQQKRGRGSIEPSADWCRRGIVPRSVQTFPPSPRPPRADPPFIDSAQRNGRTIPDHPRGAAGWVVDWAQGHRPSAPYRPAPAGGQGADQRRHQGPPPTQPTGLFARSARAQTARRADPAPRQGHGAERSLRPDRLRTDPTTANRVGGGRASRRPQRAPKKSRIDRQKSGALPARIVRFANHLPSALTGRHATARFQPAMPGAQRTGPLRTTNAGLSGCGPKRAASLFAPARPPNPSASEPLQIGFRPVALPAVGAAHRRLRLPPLDAAGPGDPALGPRFGK